MASEHKDVVTETTGLTTAPTVTYAKLGGQHQSLDLDANNEQYVTFDFMVTLSQHTLSTENHLQTAISDSVDCELHQIRDLIIQEIDDGSKNKQSRVKGKIYTDDWELPMLQKKFEKIISDRVLSGNLQSICALEDRPMIRRFFCKTSRQLQEKEKQQKKVSDLEEAHKTDSLRTLKDDLPKKKTVSEIASTTPMSKPKGKVAESVSMDKQSEGGNIVAGADGATSSEGKKSDGTVQHRPRGDDDHCDCFCVVL